MNVRITTTNQNGISRQFKIAYAFVLDHRLYLSACVVMS